MTCISTLQGKHLNTQLIPAFWNFLFFANRLLFSWGVTCSNNSFTFHLWQSLLHIGKNPHSSNNEFELCGFRIQNVFTALLIFWKHCSLAWEQRTLENFPLEGLTKLQKNIPYRSKKNIPKTLNHLSKLYELQYLYQTLVRNSFHS